MSSNEEVEERSQKADDRFFNVIQISKNALREKALEDAYIDYKSILESDSFSLSEKEKAMAIVSSLDHSRETKKIIQCIIDKASTEAVDSIFLGRLYLLQGQNLFDLETADESMKYFQKALAFFNRKLSLSDSNNIECHNHLGYIYKWWVNKPDKALDHYLQVNQGLYFNPKYYNKDLYEEWTGCFYSIASVYREKHDYLNSLYYAYEALKIYQDQKDHGGIPNAHVLLANIYADKGDYPMANKQYRYAITTTNKDNYVQICQYLNNWANCYAMHGNAIAEENLDTALFLLDKSLAINKNRNIYLMGDSYRLQGYVNNKRGHAQEALEAHQKALQAFELSSPTSGNRQNIIRSMSGVVDVYNDMKNSEKAYQTLQELLQLAYNTNEFDQILKFAQYTTDWYAHLNILNLCLSTFLGRYQQSGNILYLAQAEKIAYRMHEIVMLNQYNVENTSRLENRGMIHDAYGGIVSILFEKFQLKNANKSEIFQQALTMLQMSRSKLFMENAGIRKTLRNLNSNKHDEYLKTVENIYKGERILNSSGQEVHFSSSFFSRLQSWQKKQKQIIENLIDTEDLEGIPDFQTIPTLQTLQLLMKEQRSQSLVYYFSDHQAFLLYLNEKEFQFIKIGKEKLLSQALSKYYNLLSKFDPTRFTIDKEEFFELSTQIYHLLIPPSISLNDRSLHIFIENELAWLPFETLIRKKPNVRNLKDVSYLGKEVPVVYHPILEFITSDSSKTGQKNLLAFSFQGKSLRPFQQNLPNISFTYLEVKEIVKIWKDRGTCAFYGHKATKNRFLTEAPKYSFIHLATHASTSEENRFSNHLYFQNNHQQIDTLKSDELWKLNLSADLVVLSACETARGSLKIGEGIFHLARDFMMGGSENVVSTLWPSSDRSTHQVFLKMYKALSEGVSTAEALQHAKVDYLSESDEIGAHPFFWSGSILISRTIN